MTDATPSRTTRPLAVVALLLAGGWILAGALFKFLQGSPALLPAFMRDLPVSLETIYPTVIGIELAVVAVAWLRPRLGWGIIALQYLVFFGVLGLQIARGEESCGCMGSQVTLTPLQMLAIDGTLFSLLMISRPWSGFGFAGLPVPAVGVVAAVLVAMPWFGGRGRSVSPEDVLANRRSAPSEEVAGAGVSTQLDDVTNALEDATGEQADGSQGSNVAAGPPSSGTFSEIGTTRDEEPILIDDPVTDPEPDDPAPTESEGWTVLDPRKWVGQDVFSLDVSPWLGDEAVAQLPQDGLWVFYRQQCDHCRDHLIELANTEHGQRLVGLIQVPEATDTPDNSLIVIKPQGPHVFETALPGGVDYVLSTPADATIQGSMVVDARENIQ